MATLKLATMLMVNGRAVTLQSTIVMPYPGTKMYDDALENGWFRVDPQNYERFDTSEPVLKTADMEPEEVMSFCDEIYRVCLSPKYIFRHLIRVRSSRDVKYSFRGCESFGACEGFCKK